MLHPPAAVAITYDG